MLRRFLVAERSMAPALHPGQLVLGVRQRRPRRGRLVCLPHPHRDDFWLVKRVVGLPGERVEIADGAVLVDGAPLAEPWTVDDTGPAGAWRLGPGQMFVLSDARRRTVADSRTFGPVPVTGSYRVLHAFRHRHPAATIGP